MRLVSPKGVTALFLIMIVAGCQSLGGQSVQVPVAEGHYQLQYSWPKAPVQLWQKVEWQKGEEQRTFMVSSVFESDRLLLVALSPLGYELFRSGLSNANGLTFKGSKVFNDSRLALQVWSDLQLALWPLKSINANLTGATLQASQSRREIWHNGQLLWSSTNENRNLQRVIQNNPMGYQLTITTLEHERLKTDDSNIK
ncbi:DUF3261 domain-containing protein [Idiomarina sp. HP20-50]|uniref:DUF3261 domain-containing protein n=1 Tax=Idiomarina sp. HP20-50 TaxID=3070813 RepID=UPI00294B952A|nr:DUF3261 domain-containing protein [Idiomarina sp. HP20-50]MDV6316392.1 DUF3261 domain-containing protein [Idiomarina sp. HP20-50]